MVYKRKDESYFPLLRKDSLKEVRSQNWLKEGGMRAVNWEEFSGQMPPGRRGCVTLMGLVPVAERGTGILLLKDMVSHEKRRKCCHSQQQGWISMVF